MPESAPARDVVTGRPRSRWFRARHEVMWLFLLALVIRAVAAAANPSILNDSVTLVHSAERMRVEGLAAALSIHDHPLVPWLVARLRLEEGVETTATALCVLAGAFAVWPLHVLARRACGRHAATAACIVYAALPKAVGVASVPLTSAVFLPLFLSSISLTLAAGAHSSKRRRLVRLVSAGLMAGAAYLARPEGALALAGAIAAALLLRRRRLAAVAVVAASFVLVAAPYAIALSMHEGHLAISPKKDLGRFLGMDAAMEASKGLGASAYETAAALASALTVPALVLVLVGAFRPGRWRHRRATLARVLLLGVFLLYVASVLRLQTGWGYGGARHVLPAALLLLPFAGEGVAFLSGFLSRPVARRRLAVVLASYFAIPCAVVSVLRPVGEDQEEERRLGEELARTAAGREIVVATFAQPLVAYYASKSSLEGTTARDVALWGAHRQLLERADREGSRAALVATLGNERAQWLVLDLFRTERTVGGETFRPGADLAAYLVRDGVLATPVVSPGGRLAAFPVKMK